MKQCLYCGLISECPLNCKPVDNLVLKTYEREEEYGCEDLVSLYFKFKEIGKFIKEEKECLGKVD